MTATNASRTGITIGLLIAFIAIWIATPFINDRSGAWGILYWCCVAIIPTIGIITAIRWRSVLLGIASVLTYLAWPIVLGVVLALGGI